MRILLYAVLMVLDAAAVLLSFAAGSALRFVDSAGRIDLDVAVAMLPIFLGTALNNGAYAIDALRSKRLGIGRACEGLMFAFGSLLLLLFYLRILSELSRIVLSVGMIGSFVLVPVFRFGFDAVVRTLFKGHVTSDLVIMDGVSVQVPPHAEIIDAPTEHLSPDLSDPMMLDRLARRLRGVDRVVIACRPESERSWAMLLKGANINGEIVATEFDQVGAIGINTLAGSTTLVVATGPLSIRNRIAKRLFDLCFAVPALLVLAPVMLFTAIAIKLDSRGPVFFRQQRVGRGNGLFSVFKFRSMHVDQCDAHGTQSTARGDKRVTRVGQFIRATSVDELPQLLNVLFGSMSIIGPRPHALGSLAGQHLFWEVDERYWHRHTLKPGITGLAQVRGFRGATHQRDDLTRRLQADLEYISGWSVLRDVAILLSTVRVIAHKNAF